jgi:hypothetical protein
MLALNFDGDDIAWAVSIGRGFKLKLLTAPSQLFSDHRELSLRNALRQIDD